MFFCNNSFTEAYLDRTDLRSDRKNGFDVTYPQVSAIISKVANADWLIISLDSPSFSKIGYKHFCN